MLKIHKSVQPQSIHNFGSVDLKVWEVSINMARKFFTKRECRFAQWFKASGIEIPVDHELRISTSGTALKPLREYICSWKCIYPIDQNESASWVSNPRLLAFDIETYTNNHRAMPNSLDAKHVVYLNSLIYQEVGRPETLKKYIIIMGECNEIEGVTILKAETEYDIVRLMCQVVEDLDPEILTGYNILSYDYPYLDTRISNRMQDWPHIGRLLRRDPKMHSVSWQSSGYGHNSISQLIMEGRISIDMLPIIRRDYKLDKYDLDFVSNHFLKKGKHDVKAKVMFQIYERLQAASMRMDEDKSEFEKAKAEMTRVAEYCVQDSYLCVELFDKLKVWIGLVELSNIVGVTITEIFTRGQTCRVESQMYNIAANCGIVMDDREAPVQFFSGGAVFDPVPGLYENVLCFDFASLYPSIIMAKNLCFSTIIPPHLINQIPEKYCNIAKITQEEPINPEKKKNDEGSLPAKVTPKLRYKIYT